MIATSKRKSALPKLTEAQVTEQVIGHMRLLGYRPNRQNVGLASYGERGKVKYGETGCTDFIFTHPVRPAIYIEVKKEGESIRSVRDLQLLQNANPTNKKIRHELEQSSFIEQLQTRCFPAIWVNSLEMLKDKLSSKGQS